MNISKYLMAAGVPLHLYAAAQNSINTARERSRGLAWAKWKVRLFKAGKIAKLLPWGAERLIDVRPDLADWDIAPAVNITAHGDNAPWAMTPDGFRPAPGRWLSQNPGSEEYQKAVAANYWCKGEPPRSKKSRKAWYRRNAGEYRAWRLGVPVDLSNVQVWHANGVAVYRCGGAWEIVAVRKLIGRLGVKVRVGFEIDNLFIGGVQAWYPIAGHDLRAPVTWSVLPYIKR